MIIIFVVLLCLVCFGFLVHYNFISYLKEHHCEKWEELGSPTFLNNSIANNATVRRFLAKGEYVALNDPLLNKRAKFIKVFNRIYLGLFVVIVIMFAIYIFLNQAK